MSGAVAALVVVAAVAAGCNGGVLFAFSSFVMPGLQRLPAGQGLAAMQAINVTAVRAPFMVVFLGSALLSVALAVVALTSLGSSWAPWLLAAAALELVGVLGLTVGFHVPRNDALAALHPGAPGSAEAWGAYVREWTALNHVRAAAGLASAASLLVALRVA
jgi:uncharacterized membrane protein